MSRAETATLNFMVQVFFERFYEKKRSQKRVLSLFDVFVLGANKDVLEMTSDDVKDFCSDVLGYSCNKRIARSFIQPLRKPANV
jgi:DNA-binding ferritin-like protein (Dps family)